MSDRAALEAARELLQRFQDHRDFVKIMSDREWTMWIKQVELWVRKNGRKKSLRKETARSRRDNGETN